MTVVCSMASFGSSVQVRHGATCQKSWSPHHLLQSLRSVAAGWRLGPDHGRVGCRSRRGGADDRYLRSARASARSLCRGQQSPRHGSLARRPDEQDSRGRGHQWPAVHLALTPGEAHDNRLCSVLLSALLPQTMLLADRGYDADWIRELARQQGAWANIPPKRNRKDPICFSSYLYRARNLIGRFFNKIKQCRRVATRYDKLAANYLALVKLASIRVWRRANESTP